MARRIAQLVDSVVVSKVPAAEVRGDSEEMEEAWPFDTRIAAAMSGLPMLLTNSRDSPSEGPFFRHPRRDTSTG
jgi:hypothetical protein